MFRRLRTLVLVLIFAVLGAVAGRVAADMRRQSEAGQQPRVDLDAINLRPQDVVPGLVAAMRVRNRPWSFLHIPAWFAALCVNFGVAAVGRDLGAMRRMAAGFGLDLGDDPDEGFSPPDDTVETDGGGGATAWGAAETNGASDDPVAEPAAPSAERFAPGTA